MFEYKMKGERITDIAFRNHTGYSGNVNMNIISAFSFSADDKSQGICKLKFELLQGGAKAESESSIYIMIECEANYDLSGISETDDTNDIRNTIAKDYYPYLKSHVASIMSEAAMMPVYLPPFQSGTEIPENGNSDVS